MWKQILPLFVMAIMAGLVFTACQSEPQVSTSGAKQITTLGFEIPRNAQGNTAEQQNILDRIKVTTDPTKILWVHLIALDGTIIKRMPVVSKVTSSGKRLEPTHAAPEYEGYPGFGSLNTDELLQPDGTFGYSDDYIYWFDPPHRYHQWGTAGGLGYLLTDYPIDLANPLNEVTGMYNTHKAAYDWQLAEEAKLRAQEEQLKRQNPTPTGNVTQNR